VKVISYSLWGNNPVYTIGAVRNADLAAQLFPEWVCIFYCFESVPDTIVSQLKSRSNCIVRIVKGVGDRKSAVYRFFPAEEQGVEYLICRDTDSRLSPREVLAVNDWIDKGTDFHVMRDHPYHGVPILAGMWGIRGGKVDGIRKYAEEYVSKMDGDYKFQDQDFLTSWMWSKVSNGHLSLTTHDPFFTKSPFPYGAERGEKNMGVWFIGQCFDENDNYNSQDDVDVVVKYEQNTNKLEIT
jgi:hypothetical protein